MQNITEASRTLENIMTARKLLAAAMVGAITAKHDIATAREDAKRIEDGIVLAIWSDERFKNDKARNEQKHLARINNTELIAANEEIKDREVRRAMLHAEILELQNTVTLLTFQYEYFLLGARTEGAAEYRMVAQPVQQEDTTEAMDVKPEVVSSVVGEEQVATPVTLADKIRASLSPERVAELTDTEPVPERDLNAKVAGNTDTTVGEMIEQRKEQENAPYMKKSLTGDKKPEKIGGITI